MGIPSEKPIILHRMQNNLQWMQNELHPLQNLLHRKRKDLLRKQNSQSKVDMWWGKPLAPGLLPFRV